ncbi:MAG TPA: tetratricopeptide repeat protein [Gaiellaceae bacterium]|jgi:class 3 adenylate cyclase/tetratricopeptide (TPR) repeat protein|nr:tetratricopeptide repeat protein [Gaiellaceae bacterium]
MTAASESAGKTIDLVSFVPRLTLEWLRSTPELKSLEVEGTLAFVDISGFTAMSEQLSSLGKAGAEEVTDVMNATFAALLDVAYAEGGGLLKFGGDALLLLFDGDEHGGRAARAAFAMRSTLRTVGRPRTSAGTVTLRMHAGIHSGRFQFFLVGDSHRELLVTGPAATRTVEMEAASEAGEILLSPEAAALLDASCVGEAKGPGFLLASRPETHGTLAPLPDIEGIPLEIAVPAPLRAQLLEVGPLEGEHRNAAIGFLRFSGIDDVIATEGAHAAAEALDVLVRAVQAAAAEHNVTFLESDVDRDGGRIILVAGAPQTFGDDEERLLRTVRAAVDSGLPLPVHIGASRGRVFTGQVGATFRRTYTVLGDTAALAARLMARAGEDEIYVAEEAFNRGGTSFAGTELEPFMVKGKSEPVQAFVLGELTGGTAPAAATSQKLPFVDRERERAVLGASVAPVRMGFGTLVELIGEPGIGKSRLADELRESCADMQQLTLRCEQYESSTPYHPFRPFLRSLLDVELNGGAEHNRTALAERLGEIDEGLVPWAPLLSAPLDCEVATTPEVDELDASFRRARLHGVVGSLLGKLLDTPTLVLLEDVHWMDDASSELLRHLGTQLPTRPWLTCTTRRPETGGFAAAEGTPPLPALTLRLEPLPAEDAKTLARAATGDRQLSDEELAAITERAAGNPLFLQHLASPEEAVDETEELPETVEALVATRIDRLAPGDRALLRWASVLGTSFSVLVIRDVLEEDPTAAADSEAWDRLAEFVERDPEVPNAFRFRHALIRDAAYEGLSYRRRRELHGKVAEVLERREPDAVELLSLHFHRAEDKPATWRYSLEAGRDAQAKWANLEAAEFYERALDAASEVPGLEVSAIAATWESLGDCLHLAGRFDRGAEAYERALELTPKSSPEHIEVLFKQGALHRDMGRYDEAIRWYHRGLRTAGRLDKGAEREHLELELEMGIATVRFRQGDFRDAVKRCRAVVDRALAAKDERLQLANAYLLLHLAHTQMGSPDRVAFRGLALPIFEELGDLKRQATVLNNLGIEAYYEGDWAKALDVYERSRALFERIGDVTSVAMAQNNIGEILSDQGRLAEAEELFKTVQRTIDATGHRGLSMMSRLNLGRAAARGGRFEEAGELLRAAAEGFREIHASSFEQETHARIAEASVLAGDPERALTEAEFAELSGESNPPPALQAVIHRVRGYAYLQLQRIDDAVQEFERSIAEARSASALYELALALRAEEQVRGAPPEAGEAQRLLDALQVSELPDVPV